MYGNRINIVGNSSNSPEKQTKINYSRFNKLQKMRTTNIDKLIIKR